jgi:UDP-4-amino-4,6-dideoxy-N-acetyl-beta-L-altrosamine N-acetyltransferase
VKYTKFQDLSLKEKKDVLEWRNHYDIRKYMYNKEIISLENHLQFIESLKKNKNKIYLKIGDLGVVNFQIKNKIVEIGIHKNPNKQKVGTQLMKIAIDYAFDVLKAEKITLFVYENNKKAIHLYKKFDFKIVDKKDNLLKMELLNENRKN